MKTFSDFLTESKKTYKFFIRVAGDLPEGFKDRLETNLQKYDLVSLSGGKRTPIQEKPLDFPQLQNMEIHHFEAEVNYPVTSHVLEHYLVDNCVIPHTHIIVRREGEPVESYQEDIKDAETYETLLTTEDMGGESAQESVGTNRVMDLLKELEAARKERDVDPVDGIKAGESKDIGETENTKSTIGS